MWKTEKKKLNENEINYLPEKTGLFKFIEQESRKILNNNDEHRLIEKNGNIGY